MIITSITTIYKNNTKTRRIGGEPESYTKWLSKGLNCIHFTFPQRNSNAHRETPEAKPVCRAATYLFSFNLLPLVAASVKCRGLRRKLRCCFYFRSV